LVARVTVFKQAPTETAAAEDLKEIQAQVNLYSQYFEL